MMKQLRFAFLSMLMLFCGTAMAEDVTINFDDDYATLFPTLPGVSCAANADAGVEASTAGDFTETLTSTAVGGVTVTVSVADEGKTTLNRIWNASPRLRMYSGTFTVKGTDITKIVFNAPSKFNMTAATGTIDGKTWTGDKTNEVVFTVAGNTQMKSITVTLGEGGEVTPPTPPTTEQITVAKALEIIDGLPETGGKTTDEYQVKGFVVTVTEINTTYGNATFTMADEKGGSPVLTFFRGKGFNGADVTNTELLKEGDEVVVQGLLQKYVKNNETTPEVAQGGKIISINGKTSDDTPVEITKVANIAAFKALADGTVAELTLTNAIVTYKNVNGSNIDLFIRDNSGAAMDLFSLDINAEAGDVLNGTIIGTRGANAGFTYAMKKNAQTNAATVTVSGKQDVVPSEISSLDEATYDAYGCDLVKITSVKVSADGKKAMAGGDELALYDRFQTKLLSGLDENKDYDITGIIYDGGATYGTELVVTAVTLAGGGEIVDDPATPVASIEALLALESPSSNLELTLTDAKVLFNDGNNIYMRENGKALCFFKIDGLKDVAKNNAVVNGKIEVDYEVYQLMPEVKSNKNTKLDGLTIAESEDEAAPVETTLAEVAAGKHVCDLVTLSANLVREIEYKEDGETVNTTTYYLVDGETKLVVVNNGKGLNKLADDAVEKVTVTGIVNTSKNGYQVKLIKQAQDTAGITDITINRQADNRIFNLAGQQVEKAQKGLYIVGGKKIMVK